MSLVAREIEKILSGLVLPRPIFEVSKCYGGELTLTPIENLESCEESPIYDLVVRSVSIKWNREQLKFEATHGDCRSGIMYRITAELGEFIVKNSKSTNPKLTSLYRWYNLALGDSVLRSNQDLEDILFETWKFLKDPNRTENKETIMSLLEFIKQKYEQKGITV